MSLALSKGTCGRTFEMTNHRDGRVILCRKRVSGCQRLEKADRKMGNQWATKTGNNKEDTYTMVCILLKFHGAPGRNRTPGQELRRLLLCPTELRTRFFVRRLSMIKNTEGQEFPWGREVCGEGRFSGSLREGTKTPREVWG